MLDCRLEVSEHGVTRCCFGFRATYLRHHSALNALRVGESVALSALDSECCVS